MTPLCLEGYGQEQVDAVFEAVYFPKIEQAAAFLPQPTPVFTKKLKLDR
jgi:hypothetical protein